VLKKVFGNLCGVSATSTRSQPPADTSAAASTSGTAVGPLQRQHVQLAQTQRPPGDAHDRAERGETTGAAQPARAEPTIHIDCTVRPAESVRRMNTQMAVRVRAAAQADQATRNAAQLVDRLLSARPPVESRTELAAQGLHTQGTLMRYRGDPHHPHQARREAFYAHVPGVMLAALVVRADIGPQDEPTAEPAEHQLGAPPLALATGVWTGPDSHSYLLHNNRLHRAAPSVAAQLSAWQDITPPAMRQGRFHMLGAQADGSVLLRQGSQLLQLGRGNEPHLLQNLPQGLDDSAPLCLDAQGTVHVLDNGLLTALPGAGAGTQAPARRALALMRQGPDGTAEPSPAQPRQLLMTGAHEQAHVIVADHKGRLYQAALGASGDIQAHRMAWPEALGPSADWAATAAGLSPQGQLQVVVEHREGRCVSLQQTHPGGEFQLQFDMDQPLLLVGQTGLHAPTDAQMADSVRSLDGHARLAISNGTAHYRLSPDHAWTELQDAAGQALSGVALLETSAFGFIDRKPTVAVRQRAEDASFEVIALRMRGRTTLLPVKPPEETPPGGPLMVVPSRVTVSPQALGRLPDGATPQSLATDKDGHVFVLLTLGTEVALHTNHPTLAPQAAAGAALPTLALPPNVQTLDVAVAGNNHLHALCTPNPDPTDDEIAPAVPRCQIQVLQSDGQWEELPLQEFEGPQQAVALRTSRHGTLEVGMANDANPAQPASWHAVLPGMTRTAQGQWAPGRLDPQPSVSDEVNSGMHATINQSVDQQGASRVPVRNGTVRFTTTLMGNTSTDPFQWSSNLRNLWNTTRGHVTAMLRPGLVTIQGLAVAANLMAAQNGARQRILPIVGEASAAHGQLQRWTAQRERGSQATGHPPPLLAPAAVPPGDAQADTTARLAELRRDELQRVLGDLQKIAIRAGVLSPDLRLNPSGKTGTTASYKLGESAGAVAKQLGAALRRLPQDTLPDLQTFWNAVHIEQLPPDERQTVAAIRTVIQQLRAAGLELPTGLGAPQAPGAARAPVPSDEHAIRSANAARGSMCFERLLNASTMQGAEEVHDLAQTSELRRLARTGMSAWSEVEAFDRVVTDFRAAIADPQSPRRQQLLKSMGLPADAAPDQMASRMAELMNDLYNRSTFFSIETQSITAGGNFKVPGMLKEAAAVTPNLTLETTHLLGVERIGDSMDGDAGLVAFFVEQTKQRVAASGGLNLATSQPSTGKQPIDDEGDDQLTSNITWGAAVSGRLQLSRLRGVGVALLVARDQLPAFAQALMAPVAEPPHEMCQLGYGGEGAIGLNLLEANIEGTARGAYNVGHPVWDYLFGTSKPQPPVAGAGAASSSQAPPRALGGPGSPERPGGYGSPERPGGYGSPELPGGYGSPGAATPDSPSMPTGSPGGSNSTLPTRPAQAADPGRRGTLGFGFPTSASGALKASAQEMELHLDHAWKQILGLEFQGHVLFSTEAGLGTRGNAGLSGEVGLLAELTNVATGIFGLQLASLNAAAPDVLRIPGTVNATYKRTLDAAVAAPLSTQDWSGLRQAVTQTFPAHSPALMGNELPPLPSEQRQALQDLIVSIEGHGHGGIAALEGMELQNQKAQSAASDRTAQQAGDLPVARSAVERTKVVDTARRMIQQLDAALADRALIIPGARIEINTLGKVALDGALRKAIGHWGLGTAMMREVPQAVDQVPGLAHVLQAMKGLPMVDQVRFVFEMRPQAILAINDALALKESEDGATAAQGLDPRAHPRLDWQQLLIQARTNPNLYRLAAISAHNTDDNPTTASTVLGFATLSHTGSASHQLFSPEVQMRYGPRDELVQVEMLESAGRAMQQQLQPLAGAGVSAVGRVSQAGDPERYGPASPRAGQPGAASSRADGAGPSYRP
jgi:hypothetical protein